MRKIKKDNAPEEFNNFLTNNRPNNWNDLHENAKDVYINARFHILSKEQEYLCGYTEIFVKEVTNCHIDHFKKKSLFPKLTFEWINLIVASVDDEFGARYKDNKITENDYDSIINPVEDDPHDYFTYIHTGEIIPKFGLSDLSKQKAERTIELFKLNHNSLINRRKSLIKLLQDYNNSFPADELKEHLNSQGFLSVIDWFTN